MTDNSTTSSEDYGEGNYQSVSREEIEQYEEEHGEMHPAFRVEHRPERRSVNPDGCLWGECDTEGATVVTAYDSDGGSTETRVCADHLEELRSRTGVSVEVKDAD